MELKIINGKIFGFGWLEGLIGDRYLEEKINEYKDIVSGNISNEIYRSEIWSGLRYVSVDFYMGYVLKINN